MTCCGICVVRPDRALCWADSEIFVDDAPAGHAPKVALNALAGLIGTGAGRTAILRAAAAELHCALSLDDLIEAMPSALRAVAADLRGLKIAAKAPIAGTVFAAAGSSARCGRVVAAVFSAERDFEALCPAHVWTSPAVDDDPVDGLGDIPAVAQRQLEILRGNFPQTAGGALVGAELAGTRLRTELFDMGMGVGTRPLRRFAPPPVKSASDRNNPDSRRGPSTEPAAGNPFDL